MNCTVAEHDLFGRQAVEEARRRHPDLLPTLDPISVRSPQPPLLLGGQQDIDRVRFLVEAYLSFAVVHADPSRTTLHRMRAQAALGASPQGRTVFRKLADAARVMAGEDWGPLDIDVRDRKLPAQIAPHSWLLYSMQAHFTHRVKTYPQVDQIFSAGRLLSSERLRAYSHTASDLAAGSVRPGSAWVDRAGIGQALAALKVREQLVYERGYTTVDALRLTLSLRGDALYSCGQLLRDLHREEQDKARKLEVEMQQLARRGTWVWGRWLGDLGAQSSLLAKGRAR